MTAKTRELLATARANGKPLVGRSGRDSQRMKCYVAERVMRQYTTQLSFSEVEKLVRKIEDSAYVRKNYGTLHVQIKVSPTAGRSTATGDFLITLSQRYGLNTWAVLHEMAHCYTVQDVGHSWLWRYVYVDLVRKFISEEAGKALKDSFRKAGLRVGPPQKSRNLTPEQREAARERLAKARAARNNVSTGRYAVAYSTNGIDWYLIRKLNKSGNVITRVVDLALVRTTQKGALDLIKRVKDRSWNPERFILVDLDAVLRDGGVVTSAHATSVAA